MRQPQAGTRPIRSAGFSLIELLVVLGVIGVAAAVSLPKIGRYIRNYRIRAATTQVAGEIQSARNKAIMKNVNLGTVFVTRSATTYQWAVEDAQTGVGSSRSTVRPTLDTTFLGNATTGAGRNVAQTGSVFTLPQNVQFSTTCPSPAPTGGAWDYGMRFNRLGGWCDPGAAGCDTAMTSSAGATFVYNSSGGAVVCVIEGQTGLTRRIDILTGGRVKVQP